MANFDKSKPKSKKKDGRGGARPGAGRPKGPDPHTAAVREATIRFRSRVARNSGKLFNAQLAAALGTSHLFRKVKERNEEGKVIKTYIEEVTDAKTIQEYLDGEYNGGESLDDETNFYFITTRQPNNSAIVAMLDRGLGKVADKLEADVTSDGERIAGISDAQFAQLIRARANRGSV